MSNTYQYVVSDLAKVTLSVPDDLYKKLEEHKDRLNYSDIFRRAVSEEIEKIEEKGELIEGLMNYLGGELPKTEEKARKEEIERFTKKWGKPDSAHNLLVKAPYISLSKKQTVEYEDQKIAELEIENNKDLRFTLKDFNPEFYNEKLEIIVDYFKSKGFDCGETYLGQPQVINYVTHGDKKFARDRLSKGYQFYGLFAQDKEDLVFILHRKVEKL